MKLFIKHLIFVDNNNTVDRVSSSVSKVGGAKSKNTVIPDFLTKSKLLVKLNFK